MTEDFKTNILNYITNNIQETSPSSEEIFAEQKSIDRSAWRGFLPRLWNNFRFEGMIAPDESVTGLGVLYGGYIDENNNSRGIITLFDDNFEPVKTFFEFSSGTKLRYIQYMKQAEDGTFYFVDDNVFTYENGVQSISSQKRFVMVGNFTVKNQLTDDYQVVLRTSYNFPNNYKNFYCKNMFKSPNSSTYVFFGSGADSTSPNYSYRYLKIFGLKVNVGEANDWTLYHNEQYRLFGSAYALFDAEDNVSFRCVSTGTLSSSRTVDCVSKTYTATTTTTTPIATFSYQPYIDDYTYKKQSVFLDMDNVYFVINNQRWGVSGSPDEKYIGLYKYNFADQKLTSIFSEYLGLYDYCNLAAIFIDKNVADIYVQYNTNVDDTNYTADYYFQRLKNDTWDPILIAQNQNFNSTQRTLFIKNNFNLLQIYLYATNPRLQSWFQYLIKEDYNILNYNGVEYTDYNSTLPTKTQLYSGDSLAFARNLYNKTENNNITVSTVTIPNSYLNDLTINNEALLSETNSELVNNNKNITKNIYETVNLNFVNTLYVLNNDKNIVDSAGTYINTNINVGTSENCNDSFIGKIRVNYDETTSLINSIIWTKTDDTHAVTEFALTLDNKQISSIEFMSNDLTTTYITVIPQDLEVGKTYKFTQYLKIE